MVCPLHKFDLQARVMTIRNGNMKVYLGHKVVILQVAEQHSDIVTSKDSNSPGVIT